MRMSGHRTRAVFDRYNVVSVDDQSAAVGRLDESWTRFGHFSKTRVQTKGEDHG